MFILVILLAAAALVIDVGQLYYSYQQLQASTQAAALAGGQAIPSGTAVATAKSYDGVTGNKNANANLSSVSLVTAPKVECLTSSLLPPCLNYGEGLANAIVVQQQAAVKTSFMRLFGIPSFTLQATATASARGGANGIYNVMMIVDTTDSMTDTDTGSNCNGERIACALGGVKTLLLQLAPCSPALSSCTGTYSAGSVIDDVGIMTFPGLVPSSPGGSTSNYTAHDYTCGQTLPNGSTETYNNSPVYTIVGLGTDASTNYKTTATSNTLSTSSSAYLVTSAGAGCSGGNNAMNVKGGEGTFYAGAIDAAQAALVAEQTARTAAGITSQNVMILISDGDATASSSQMAGSATSYSSSNECKQAVTSAQNAANAGTWVYAVAYGAESSGCGSDSSPYNSPCYTMEHIANSPGHIPDTTKFYSDYQQTGTGIDQTCIGTAQSTTNINQIFTDIAGDLTVARIIPNNTP
jgi:hypothetical protein